MSLSTEEWVTEGSRWDTEAPIQEKVGGVPCSQAQGAEQIRELVWPDCRDPGTKTLGVWVRAGRGEGGTQAQEAGSGLLPETPAPARMAESLPALSWGHSWSQYLPVTRTESF